MEENLHKEHRKRVKNEFLARGYDVAVVDNLSTGHRAAVADKARFYEGDIRDKDFLADVFTKESDIEGVMHFCAYSLVGESMEKPLMYFENNVGGAMTLLDVMHQFDVKHIVFSSTAATFGIPEVSPITETTPQNPINPYGESKLIMEKMMKWTDIAHGLKYVALRYFNACGAHESGMIGEAHAPETHLIPLILQVPLGKREFISIFGDDYDTADGTCIRDYIHVCDLAEAHILAMQYLVNGGESTICNLGNGEGFSVLEMIEAAREVTNHPIPAIISPRRAGDPAKLIASSQKAQEILGWKPQITELEDIVESAWNWHKKIHS